jgi:hypothetical protein
VLKEMTANVLFAVAESIHYLAKSNRGGVVTMLSIA